MTRHPIAWTVAFLLCAEVSPAHAALDEPLMFGQAGIVTLTLDVSRGGFDHLLDRAAAPGPIGTPLLVLTDSADPSAEVLGLLPATVGDQLSLGPVAAGEEIVLRISNVGSVRLGTPGEFAGQVFTGSASAFNPDPGRAYSFVDWLSPTRLVVRIEDLFGADPAAGVLDDWDLQFTLALAPVPEPGPGVLLAAGLLALGWLARRRVAAA